MKILILYTSAGYGHFKIAENIAAVLRQDHSVDLINLFEVENGKITTWGTKVYLWVIKRIPWLWNFFYTNKIFLRLTLPLRTKIAAKKSQRILDIINRGGYDVVICTQVNASAILSYLKKKNLFRGKLVVTFSDFHLHPFWMFDNVDLYLANITEQKEEMVALGIAPEKIAVIGITVQPLKQIDETALRIKYNLTPDDKVVLFAGGGRGYGINYETVSEALELGAKVFVVCGKNVELENELKDIFAQTDARIFGYVDNMQELYQLANIVVSKPGGLTVTECLQRNLPMLVSAYLPGQEKLNYDYLRDKSLILPDLVGSDRGVLEDELKTSAFHKDLINNQTAREIAQEGEQLRKIFAV